MPLRRFSCVVGVVTLLAHSSTQTQTAALPETIPIFPLEVTMLFPGVDRPLHIFESRYRAMVADALKGDRIIGICRRDTGNKSPQQGDTP